MFTFRMLSWPATLAVAILGTAAAAEGLTAGNAEISGFGGGAQIRAEGEGSTKGLFGGGLAVGLAPRAALYFEFSHIPLENESMSVPGGSASVNSKLYALEAGINIHLVSPESRVIPYIVAGGGFGHTRVKESGRIGQRSYSESASESGGLAGGGIGVRLYGGKNWGIKPEFKVQRGFAKSGGVTFYRFQAGLFYQFGK